MVINAETLEVSLFLKHLKAIVVSLLLISKIVWHIRQTIKSLKEVKGLIQKESLLTGPLLTSKIMWV